MDDFVAYTSRWRTALITAGSLGFVATGIWMAGLIGPVPESRRMGPLMVQFWGWISIIFFGLCAIAGAKMWWTNTERLRIGQSGIRWKEWSDQIIPWKEISDVTEWQYRGSKGINLHLHDPSRFPRNSLFRLTRPFSGGDIGITLVGTDRSFDEAMSAIEIFRTHR